MKLINRMKVFEQKYVFLRWATGAEYGKIVYVGDDYIEFNIVDVDTMEYRETLIILATLVLEISYGGPDVARIIGIADAYDAMNSKRVYRDSLSPFRIRQELLKGKGTQFDPDLVEILIKLIKSGVV